MLDEALNKRYRTALSKILGEKKELTERRMMGGMCFMLNGNMIGGADRHKESNVGRFMFRVGKDNEPEALKRPGASVMEQGGRRMSGLIFVNEAQCDATALKSWVELALSFVESLPPK